MNTYKLNSELLKSIYELTSTVEGLEIFLSVQSTGFKFQSYNAYNTYLYNYTLPVDLFELYEYVPIKPIKFKYVSNLLKSLSNIVTILIDDYGIYFKTEDTTISIDYMVADADEIIPTLDLGKKYYTIQVPLHTDFSKILSEVCEKISEKVYLQIKEEKMILTAYNTMSSVKKIKSICWANADKFEIYLTYTSRLKSMLTSLKNYAYSLKFYNTQNVIEIVGESANFQFIVMGECLTSE